MSYRIKTASLEKNSGYPAQQIEDAAREAGYFVADGDLVFETPAELDQFIDAMELATKAKNAERN